MGNISKEQSNIIKEDISNALDRGLSHNEIIDKLGMDRRTFYRHLRQIRDRDKDLFTQIELDNASYRAVNLLRSFEETARICTNIANSDKVSNKDRIEARKAVDLANAHIYRLVSEGATFHILPEVKAYMPTLPTNDSNNHKEYEDSTVTDTSNHDNSNTDSNKDNSI